VVDHLLDGTQERAIGGKGRRVCRFCEQPVGNSAGRFALPTFLGPRTLTTLEECDDCHDVLRETLDGELALFLSSFQTERLPGPMPSIPVGALKALARIALGIMPARDLNGFEETIEWVCNPDHDFDVRLLDGLGCFAHYPASPRRAPWTLLARRKT